MIIATLREKLPVEDKAMLGEQLSQHIDERGALYLRLSKQDLYRGRLLLSETGDVVKLKMALAPYVHRKYKVVEIYRRIGLTA